MQSGNWQPLEKYTRSKDVIVSFRKNDFLVTFSWKIIDVRRSSIVRWTWAVKERSLNTSHGMNQTKISLHVFVLEFLPCLISMISYNL